MTLVKKYWFVIPILLALIYRVHACFETPIMTADTLRHLAYSSHGTDFAIYNTKAKDFAPEILANMLPHTQQTYIYPPCTLLFFFLFSSLGLGIFWIKLVLTAMAGVCAYLFFKHVSKSAGVLFFCAPVCLWYTSHEGQFEVLQTLLIILTILAFDRRRWLAAGLLLAFSVQIKLWGGLVLPWMIYEIWLNRKESPVAQTLQTLTAGFIIGFLPFLPYYIHTPDLLLIPFWGGTPLELNYYSWDLFKELFFCWTCPIEPQINSLVFYWTNLFSYALLAAVLGYTVIYCRRQKFIISTVPLYAFWIMVKSKSWAMFWYPIVGVGLAFCFRQKKRLVTLLLLLHFLGGIDSPMWMAGQYNAPVEPPFSYTTMKNCMFTCDARQHSPKMKHYRVPRHVLDEIAE